MSDTREEDKKWRLTGLPKPFADWLASGGAVIEDDEGDDWDVRIKRPSRLTAEYLPPGSLEIAANGVGDFLFLSPDASGFLGEKVSVYWHEGPSVEVLAENIGQLIAPLAPTPSQLPPVLYHGSDLPVRLNDVVEFRFWHLFKRVGVVTYVPGISPKNRDMEHHRLTWVGIRTSQGECISEVVIPETTTLRKGIQLIRRGREDKTAKH